MFDFCFKIQLKSGRAWPIFKIGTCDSANDRYLMSIPIERECCLGPALAEI